MEFWKKILGQAHADGHGRQQGHGGSHHGSHGSHGSHAPAHRPAPGSACPRCQTPLASGMRFCPQCGQTLSPGQCRQCNATLPANSQFCSQCGSPAH
ncbi:putative virion core protein [Aquitalea magnusonii]|uniref:Putative virion core protein n=1 Tax=Aquitalea magnusonii TaxID=332411 RepID=A0A3G9GLN2_9NEIS|nr:zinc ribbon domain-containing protein [Aquitalea magnusonii]BBF87653.1 putative virion core protein [Aquitalea magnusonii]